jgi:Ca2+-binding RTX toxin-like protein/subtilisin-like proprotein convertase family protein
MESIMPLPTDPLFGLQWFLRNTGQAGGTAGIDINVLTAWNDYNGAGIRIGIYDDGVQITHPDLQANYLASLQPIIGGTAHVGTPTQASDNHGTPVAGLIVASGNNNVGVVGVAYGASFGTGRFLGADGPTSDALLNAMNMYDVVNHSWGSTRSYFVDGPLPSGFQNAVDTGRGGLGTIMVKSAGNERVGGGNEPVGRDANDSIYNSSRYNVIVGAINNTGDVAEYSSPSANLLVSAPAGPTATGLNQDISTDRTGTDGYNNGSGTPNGEPDYAAFNGTSAAAPVTSGVVALILQANPGLGWRDVQDILAYSARHVGSAMNGAPIASESDTWTFNRAGNWNGGGLHFSNDYGFGLVDATTAVRLAENWFASGSTAQRSNNEVTATANIAQTMQAIPNNNGNVLTYTVNLTGAMTIQQMALSLQLNHTAVGDLRIDLTSPTGAVSNIWLGTNAGTAIDTTWSFGSQEFRGEAAAGTWTITIRDSGALGAGSVGNISLTAFGSTRTADDHYIYTPEFATYSNLAGRNTLTDTGGTDVLDAGSILTASTVDLRAGNASTLAGQTLTIAAGTVIENAYTGDGNDIITGNDAANLIRSGRGNDSISAGLGNDSLFGGTGDDTLDGGAGTDSLVGGAGDDTYTVDNTGDGVVELANEGTDTVDSSVTFTLGANVENLRLAAAGGAINGTGNGANNVLTGNAASNVLNGGVGADTMIGGASNDFYTIDNAGDVITEQANEGFDYVYSSISFTWFGNIEYAIATGAAALTGTGDGNVNTFDGTGRFNGVTFLGLGGADVLYGSNYADSLDGGDGNDIILAYLAVNGADTLTGGLGDDVYYLFQSGDTINESTGEGFDTFYTQANVTLAANVEQAVVYGAATTVNGNSGDNNLFGLNSNNSLVLNGGDGNDWVMGSNQDDTLTGGIGNDILQGLNGVNRMEGGAGDDVYYSTNRLDVIFENAGEGRDTLYANYNVINLAGDLEQLVSYGGATEGSGNSLANTLYGNNNTVGMFMAGYGGADLIFGSNFADTIIGGSGSDTLVGLGGNDLFKYISNGNMGDDLIIDFTTGADRIDLSGRGYAAGDISSAITLTAQGGGTLITFAGGTMQFSTIMLAGVANVTAADFLF